MYYELQLTQQDIANRLGMSRPVVSRLLTRAHNEGIVKISISHPLSRAEEITSKIKARFRLRDVVVIPSSLSDHQVNIRRIARAAADYLLSHLRDGEVLGVGRGATVYATVNALAGFRPGIEAIPLTGGMGHNDAAFQVNELARLAAEKLGGTCLYLYAPATVSDRATRDGLFQERHVAPTVARWDRLSLALVGVGSIFQARDPEYQSRVKKVMEGTGRHPVADICGRLLDEQGREIAWDRDHVVAVELEQLHRCGLVLAVAGGEAKARALFACIKGGHLDVLITDEQAAAGLVRLATEGHEPS